MKAAAIILGALCVILGFALYQRGASSSAEIQRLETNQVTLSNSVTELRTRLALSDGTASQVKSNLQFQLEKRTADLNVLSNRLVQTHLILQTVQKEMRAKETDLQGRIARVAVLEAELPALRQAAAQAGDSDGRELALVNERVEQIEKERDELKAQLGALQVAKAELDGKLLDAGFLERQLKLAEEAASIRRRMASARTGASPDPRMKLELQEDGTVRYVAPSPASAP